MKPAPEDIVWLHRAVAATGLVFGSLGVSSADYGFMLDPETRQVYLFVLPDEGDLLFTSLAAMRARALFFFVYETPHKGRAGTAHPLVFMRDITEWARAYKGVWAATGAEGKRVRRDAWLLVATTGLLAAYLESDLPDRYPPPPGAWRRLLSTLGASATGWGVHARPRWVAA